MAAFIQLILEHIPAPLLWAAAGAGSCCGGLCIGLYFANPAAFEILMADDDDEDAQNQAIGQPTLELFAQSVLVSALVNGCASFFGLNSNVSLGCCGLSCVVVAFLTAWQTFQEVHKLGQSLAKERKTKLKVSKPRTE